MNHVNYSTFFFACLSFDDDRISSSCSQRKKKKTKGREKQAK